MKKITTPHLAQEDKYIFTEGINYFNTGSQSIWGKGEKDTLQILKGLDLKGRWLNLAAGDGRYNSLLLRKVNVVVTDEDESALSKLYFNTPLKYRKRLDIKKMNLTHHFPFNNESFDGVFCTGTLHLFPQDILHRILIEIERVLKKNGMIIFDFATDIKRISPDGIDLVYKNETRYTSEQATLLIQGITKEFKVNINQYDIPEELVHADKEEYVFSCNYFLVVGNKIDQ